MRINNKQTGNGNKTYARDYVIDYTSLERNDLAVLSHGYMEQKHLYTAKHAKWKKGSRGHGDWELASKAKG